MVATAPPSPGLNPGPSHSSDSREIFLELTLDHDSLLPPPRPPPVLISHVAMTVVSDPFVLSALPPGGRLLSPEIPASIRPPLSSLSVSHSNPPPALLPN